MKRLMNETTRQFLAIDWTAKLKEAIKERQQSEGEATDLEIIYVATDQYEHFCIACVITEDESNFTLRDLELLHGDPAISSMTNLLFECGGQVAFKGGNPYVNVKQIPYDEGLAYTFEFEVYFPIKERLEKFLAGQET